jgi:ADP-ribose pyrophosphatase YjhB (NUDIX family)
VACSAGAGRKPDVERFCSRCGRRLGRRREGGRLRPACGACGHIVYGRFSLGVGGLLVHRGRVLLAQRAHDPGRGRWTLPGGFVEEDESPDRAVEREVFEETGLRVKADGILAVRHAQTAGQQNAYLVLRLRLAGPMSALRPGGDGCEVSRAVFADPRRLDALGPLGLISRWAIRRFAGAACAPLRRVPEAALPAPPPGHAWTAVFAGPAVRRRAVNPRRGSGPRGSRSSR